MIDEALRARFKDAIDGKTDSLFLLTKEYLKHPDNPDFVERAYRLLINEQCKVSDVIEKELLLLKFHWGDYGRKYINFVEVCEFLHCKSDNNEFDELQKSIKDKLSSVASAEEFPTNFDKWLRACYLYLEVCKGGVRTTEILEEAMQRLSEIREKDLLHCANHLRGTICLVYLSPEHIDYYEKSDNYFQRAAKQGSLAAICRLAGVQFLHDYELPPNPIKRDLFTYNLQAAKREYAESMYIVGKCFKGGIGTVNNDRKAFKWLYKAAYKGSPRLELADFYRKNSIQNPNNAEGFAWLLEYDHNLHKEVIGYHTKELPDSIMRGQKSEFKGKPQKVNERYEKRFEEQGVLGPYTSEDLDPYLDYILDEYAKKDNLVFDATEDVSRILSLLGKNPFVVDEINASLQAASLSKEQTPPTEEHTPSTKEDNTNGKDSAAPEQVSSPPEEKNHSANNTSKAYKFQSKYIKDFNVGEISLTLKIGRSLSKNESIDFSKIIIKYAGVDKEEKLASLYEPDPNRVNTKARQLLFCLACQSNEKDDLKRGKRIKKILEKDRSYESTRLNNMLRTMFPDCPLPNKNCMIHKKKGLVTIKLATTPGEKWLDCMLCKDCKIKPNEWESIDNSPPHNM